MEKEITEILKEEIPHQAIIKKDTEQYEHHLKHIVERILGAIKEKVNVPIEIKDYIKREGKRETIESVKKIMTDTLSAATPREIREVWEMYQKLEILSKTKV